MARSYDIADLMTSDGEYITDNVRRKINGNFRRILRIMQQELPSQERQQIANTVTVIVDNILDQRIPEIMDDLLDDAYPVGSVIMTATASDPRLSHGTWQQVGSGRYIRAAGGGISVMDTGGTDEIELRPENIPAQAVTVPVVESEDIEQAVKLMDGTEVTPISVEPEYIALLFYRRIS